HIVDALDDAAVDHPGADAGEGDEHHRWGEDIAADWREYRRQREHHAHIEARLNRGYGAGNWRHVDRLRVRVLLRDLIRFEAEEQRNAIIAITFPLWSGDSKDHKAAAREGNRRRTKYLNELAKAAGQETSDLLLSGEQLI